MASDNLRLKCRPYSVLLVFTRWRHYLKPIRVYNYPQTTHGSGNCLWSCDTIWNTEKISGVICGTFHRWNSAKYTFSNFRIPQTTPSLISVILHIGYNKIWFKREREYLFAKNTNTMLSYNTRQCKRATKKAITRQSICTDYYHTSRLAHSRLFKLLWKI